jgi:RNA polymerase sigma factor (sigma-70 family)
VEAEVSHEDASEGERLEADLVAAARRGSEAAFARLVDRHQRPVRAFLRRACGGDDALADDLAQETFLAAWTGLPSWRGEAGFRTWLCAIAWRKCASAVRRQRRGRARDAAWLETTELQRGEEVTADARLAVEQALAQLPLEQRAAVALCLAGDFSHAEAAVVLGSPLGTVKSHVARGKARLAGSLAAFGRPGHG